MKLQNEKCDDEILKIIEIARGVFNSMLKTINARHISMTTRKRIIKAYTWSTLLYGCEMWTITTRITTKLQSFAMWPYREMMNVGRYVEYPDATHLEDTNSPVWRVPKMRGCRMQAVPCCRLSLPHPPIALHTSLHSVPCLQSGTPPVP